MKLLKKALIITGITLLATSTVLAATIQEDFLRGLPQKLEDANKQEEVLTREQLAEIVYQALKDANYEFPELQESKFTDTTNDKINMLGQLGIFFGKETGVFATKDQVSATELAVILARTCKLLDIEADQNIQVDKNKYKDIAGWATDEITYLYGAGILNENQVISGNDLKSTINTLIKLIDNMDKIILNIKIEPTDVEVLPTAIPSTNPTTTPAETTSSSSDDDDDDGDSSSSSSPSSTSTPSTTKSPIAEGTDIAGINVTVEFKQADNTLNIYDGEITLVTGQKVSVTNYLEENPEAHSIFISILAQYVGGQVPTTVTVKKTEGDSNITQNYAKLGTDQVAISNEKLETAKITYYYQVDEEKLVEFGQEEIKIVNGQVERNIVDSFSTKVVSVEDTLKVEVTPRETETPAPTTAVPTEEPTVVPTEEPTTVPTEEPTAVPTEEPTTVPSEEPTAMPSEEPTVVPSAEPTV